MKFLHDILSVTTTGLFIVLLAIVGCSLSQAGLLLQGIIVLILWLVSWYCGVEVRDRWRAQR